MVWIWELSLWCLFEGTSLTGSAELFLNRSAVCWWVFSCLFLQVLKSGKTGNHRVNISLTPSLPLLRVVPTEEGGSYLVPTELGWTLIHHDTSSKSFHFFWGTLMYRIIGYWIRFILNWNPALETRDIQRIQAILTLWWSNIGIEQSPSKKEAKDIDGAILLQFSIATLGGPGGVGIIFARPSQPWFLVGYLAQWWTLACDHITTTDIPWG